MEKKIEIEVVRDFTDEQIVGTNDIGWQRITMEMRDEAHEQLKAQGGSWFDYVPTMHNELMNHNRLRLVIKHKKELAR